MELLNVTNAYEPDADAYLEWLKTGLKNFKN
jgi:thiol:disulfide interchange protein DsbD